MARPLRMLVLGSMAVAAAVASSAQATTCASSPLEGARDVVRAMWTESAAVFVGTLRTLAPAGAGHVAAFEPETSFKGEPGGRIAVRVPRELRTGERYLVFAHEADGALHASRPCGLGANRPLHVDEAPVTEMLAVLRTIPPPGAGGELFVRVYPWRRDLEGTPIFLEHEDGTRLVALDRDGVARASELRPGDYRITMPRMRGSVTCRWSRECGPLRVPDRGLVPAVLQVLRPSTVSLSSYRTERE